MGRIATASKAEAMIPPHPKVVQGFPNELASLRPSGLVKTMAKQPIAGHKTNISEGSRIASTLDGRNNLNISNRR